MKIPFFKLNGHSKIRQSVKVQCSLGTRINSKGRRYGVRLLRVLEDWGSRSSVEMTLSKNSFKLKALCQTDPHGWMESFRLVKKFKHISRFPCISSVCDADSIEILATSSNRLRLFVFLFKVTFSFMLMKFAFLDTLTTKW